MGLPMQNIHAPTVSSASASSTGSSSGELRDDVPITDLMKQKDALEAEMTALGGVLESHGATMATSLLTFDGFPRSDIDVAQIRTTRARIIHLQTDHKALLARIEPKLYEYFAARREEADSDPAVDASAASSPPRTATTTTAPSAPSTSQPSPAAPAPPPPTASSPPPTTSHQPLPAFALVNTVSPASPADAAGLQPGDRIQRFGDADWTNHDKLARVAQIVGRSEGREIAVVVLRGGGPDGREAQVAATLVPRTGWGGRGSLGCHLLPL